METITKNAVVTENDDYTETKGETISKLLWWVFGITGVRFLFCVYELMGGYVPVPNMGNQAVYLLISIFSTVTVIMLGKYHKLYKIGGIFAAAGCVAKLILPLVKAALPPATSFLDFLSEPTHPIYKLFNSLSIDMPVFASILVGTAHMLFSKHMNEKIRKGWGIALIAYAVIYFASNIGNTVNLFVPQISIYTSLLNRIIQTLVIPAIYAVQVVLLYFMAKKAKEIE
jgi:hypothetical protein